MRTLVLIRSLLFSLLLMGISSASFAQIGISVGFGPPAIPVYEQPICPAEGYIWTPGYWAWDGDDYYWVPGTWVLAPRPGFFWTPGYWGWGGSAFFFHEGYWGPQIGFYGGINYGFGYFGHGYEGGRWDHDHFYYNTYVNHVNTTIIHNTYNTRIENVNVTRVSYNGGNGGIEARPSGQEESYSREHHIGPVAEQNQHMQQARSNPELRASRNQGRPPIAATARPGDFKGESVPAREAGAPYKAPERTGSNSGNRPPSGNNHASELQPHQYTPPNTGSAETDKKFQQQEEKLAAKQNQDHQKMQQQQEKEHQQMMQKNASAERQQQMEQRHSQQTQHLEQQHAAQQQKVETHQQQSQPHQSAPNHH